MLLLVGVCWWGCVFVWFGFRFTFGRLGLTVVGFVGLLVL